MVMVHPKRESLLSYSFVYCRETITYGKKTMVIPSGERAQSHYGFYGFKQELLFSYSSYGSIPLFFRDGFLICPSYRNS